jgi:DNA-binding transcriptional MocR family regulator
MTPERLDETSMRLSFALVGPEKLDEGVRRLAAAARAVRRMERAPMVAMS